MTYLPRNWTDRGLILIVLAAVFCLATFDITEHDYWWHLKTGEYIVTNRTIPCADVFSYTATHPWVAHYWLADVILFIGYRAVGTSGLILLNAALIAMSFLMIITAARRRGGPLTLTLLLAFLAALASRPRFYVRPESLSLFFVALYVLLYTVFKREGKRYPLLLFPLLQLAWFNLYGGGAITGLALLGALFAGDCADVALARVIPGRKNLSSLSPENLRAFGLSLAAAIALSFVNPNTYKTVFYFTMSRNEVFRYIAEWKPTTLRDLLGLHGLFILCGTASLIHRRRTCSLSDVALFAFFALISLDAWRTLPFLALVAAPVIAEYAGEGYRRILPSPRAGRRAALSLALGIIVFTPWYLFRDTGHFTRDYSFGLDVNRKLLPVQACDFIEKHDIQGRMFNSYGIGGYLIWRFWPERKVFVDGRVEMYGIPFLAEYMFYWRPDVWQRYERDYGITYAVIDREPNYTTEYLDAINNWVLVFFDDRAMVYLKRTPEHAQIIEQYGYRYLKPGSLNFGYLDPLLVHEHTAREVIAELERSVHPDETYNLNAHLMLGYAYAKLGLRTYNRAIAHYEKALALMPEGDDIRHKITQLKRGVTW